MGNLDVILNKIGLPSYAELRRVNPDIALLEICNIVIEKYFGLGIGIISKEVGYPIKLVFQVAEDLPGYGRALIIIVNIEIFRAVKAPVELFVLYPVFAKGGPRLLSMNMPPTGSQQDQQYDKRSNSQSRNRSVNKFMQKSAYMYLLSKFFAILEE